MKLHSPPFFLTGILLPTSESGCKHFITGITDALLEPSARSGAGYLLQTTCAVQLGNAASIFISIPDLLFSGIGLPTLPRNEGKKKGGGGGGKKLFDFF